MSKSNTLEYGVWTQMKQRCNNPNLKAYPNYGGRGITVCPAWENSFEQFMQDMGPRPPGGTLEREDTNGNYEAANCLWASRQAQQRNRRCNHNITHNGVTQCLSAWAQQAGMSPATLKSRLRCGWTMDEAMNLPLRVGIMMTWNGVTQSMRAWATELKVSYSTLYRRVQQLGWSDADALSTPVAYGRPRKPMTPMADQVGSLMPQTHHPGPSI